MAFPIRFLIDECLSPKLAEALANDATQITHVNFRGLRERADPAIARWCVDNNHAFITNNARDFRAIYAKTDVHPGLVILLPNVEYGRCVILLRAALERATSLPSLVNTLIEIDLDGAITVVDLPEREDIA